MTDAEIDRMTIDELSELQCRIGWQLAIRRKANDMQALSHYRPRFLRPGELYELRRDMSMGEWGGGVAQAMGLLKRIGEIPHVDVLAILGDEILLAAR